MSGATKIHEAAKNTPKVIETDRVLYAYVHDDAHMCIPRSDWLHNLRYGTDYSSSPTCSDRMLAAVIGDSYRYLLMSCDKNEAWRRIELMRKAVLAYDKTHD